MCAASTRLKSGCAAMLCALPLLASAEPIGWKLQCQAIGSNPQEPIGDREGHALTVNQYSCRVEGGPLDGAILTGQNTSEWDKGVGKRLGGFGIYRKPGAMAVYQYGDGQTQLLSTDGKVTGFRATGVVTYVMATGPAAVLQGRKATYSATNTGPGTFSVDVKAE